MPETTDPAQDPAQARMDDLAVDRAERRQLIWELTQEAIDEGTYGEPAPKMRPETTAPAMLPADVPAEWVDEVVEIMEDDAHENCTPDEPCPGNTRPYFTEQARHFLAAVYPLIAAAERTKVADELREDADAHRRLVARKPSEHDDARLARAKTLDDAAARITRGGQP